MIFCILHVARMPSHVAIDILVALLGTLSDFFWHLQYLYKFTFIYLDENLHNKHKHNLFRHLRMELQLQHLI